jgi:nucleoid-associated protein YgaU
MRLTMKTLVRLTLLITLIMSIALVASAQEMTKDQWQQAMQEATQKRDPLQAEVQRLEADIVKLKTQDASLAQQVGKCQEDLMSLLGTTSAQEKEFAAFLDQIDSRLNELSTLSNQDLFMRRAEIDTVQFMITRAKNQKLALLPANDQRLNEEQHRLDMLRESLKSILAQQQQVYTVGTWARNHDCLWNIAKKPKIYDNAFLWPKIWQENRDEIKNPDIIHTGQKLRIPAKSPLNAKEKSALQSYWHQRKEIASASSPNVRTTIS